MNERLFDRPVFVKDSHHFVREIASIDDAIDFLDEWPEDLRDLIHQTAWQACYDAADGHKPLYVGRNAFEGFAKRAEILEDRASIMPWMIPIIPG